MKINKKDQKLLLYIGGILPLILVYFLLFVPTQGKNQALSAANEELEQELTRREALDEEKEAYRARTGEMEKQISEALLSFPAGIREETAIMYADTLERQSDMKIAGISIGAENQLCDIGEGISLSGSQITYTFTSSYGDFKKNVEAIQSDKEKRNVENVILSFDSASGKLVGSMTVNLYSVQGSGKEYKEPQMPQMSTGTNNIFGGASSSHTEKRTAADDADAGEAGDSENDGE